MSFSAPVFTNAGKALQMRSLAGETLTFTSIRLGDGQLTSQSVAELTSLMNTIVSVPITSAKRTDKYYFIKGSFTNQALSAGFYWREIGVYAVDPDHPDDRSKDILYCYQNAYNLAEYIASSGSEIIEKVIKINVFVGNAEQVSAVIDSSVIYLTQADLDGYAKKSDIPTKLPANGGNADTVDGKHATDFAQNFSSWTSGSVKDLLVSAKSGFVFIQNTVTDMPADNFYWFGYVHASSTHRQLVVGNISTNAMFAISYNSGLAEGKRWTAWKNLADGGNALSLNGVAAYEYLQRIRHGVNIGTNPTATDTRGLYFWGKDGTALATGSVTNAIGTNGDSVTTIDARNNKASEQARYRIDIRSNADGGGYVAVTAPSSSGRSALRNISSGSPAVTTALCPTGAWYGQYE